MGSSGSLSAPGQLDNSLCVKDSCVTLKSGKALQVLPHAGDHSEAQSNGPNCTCLDQPPGLPEAAGCSPSNQFSGSSLAIISPVLTFLAGAHWEARSSVCCHCFPECSGSGQPLALRRSATTGLIQTLWCPGCSQLFWPFPSHSVWPS